MSETIIIAMIGGAFTLLGTLLGFYLDRKWPKKDTSFQTSSAPHFRSDFSNRKVNIEAKDNLNRTKASESGKRTGFSFNLFVSSCLGVILFYSFTLDEPILFIVLSVIELFCAGYLLNPKRSYSIAVLSAVFFALPSLVGFNLKILTDFSRSGFDHEFLAVVFGGHIIISSSIITLRRWFARD